MSAIKRQEIVNIDGVVYTIDAFKGIEGWKLLPKVTKQILPFIFGASGKGTSDLTEKDFNSVEDLNDEVVLKNLMELLSGQNVEELIELVQDLLKRVSRDSQIIDFDNEFAQNYLTMFKLVFEVIKLNYLKSFQKLDTSNQ